jgi:tyrosine-protein kinase Etk/Wzc
MGEVGELDSNGISLKVDNIDAEPGTFIISYVSKLKAITDLQEKLQ